jgi:hypothetical protein
MLLISSCSRAINCSREWVNGSTRKWDETWIYRLLATWTSSSIGHRHWQIDWKDHTHTHTHTHVKRANWPLHGWHKWDIHLDYNELINWVPINQTTNFSPLPRSFRGRKSIFIIHFYNDDAGICHWRRTTPFSIPTIHLMKQKNLIMAWAE